MLALAHTPAARAKALTLYLAYWRFFLGSRAATYPGKTPLRRLSFCRRHISRLLKNFLSATLGVHTLRP
jgi:hypothetical protein